jgi:hypothetical protein
MVFGPLDNVSKQTWILIVVIAVVVVTAILLVQL